MMDDGKKEDKEDDLKRKPHKKNENDKKNTLKLLGFMPMASHHSIHRRELKSFFTNHKLFLKSGLHVFI